MNAEYRPNACDLSPVRFGKQTPVLWIDRGVGLHEMYEAADHRLRAVAELCQGATLANIDDTADPFTAGALASAVVLLVEDARGLIDAHHAMACDNAATLTHYGADIGAVAKAKDGGPMPKWIADFLAADAPKKRARRKARKGGAV
jgi:hypothetical protein